MEAIIGHFPITYNGPIHTTYGYSPYSIGVYCTCCAKSSKAKSTVAHADPTHRGTGGFCLPVLAARHEHVRFPMCTQKRKGLPIIPCCIFKTYGCAVAQLVIKIDLLWGRVEGLPLFTIP